MGGRRKVSDSRSEEVFDSRESEKLVEDWKDGMITMGIGLGKQND